MKGLTATEVIEKTGFSKSYFYDVMKGVTVPSLINSRKLSKVLDVHLNELFPEDEK